MNRKILLTMLLLFLALFSVSAISASDVNVTDSGTIGLVDDTSDVSVPLENTADSSELSVNSDSNVDNDPSKVSLSSEEVLESEDSKSLSTNSNTNNLVQSSSTTKTSTQLISPTTSIYYKGSFSITLKDSNNVPISGKVVKFVINGVSYSGTTNSNGVASVALSLNPGKYTAKASFAGDDNYAAASDVSSTINVLATIKSNDVTKYYKGSKQYTATFYTSQGKALANTKVSIAVNGKTYTQKTNSKGVASLPINLKPGTYKVVSTDPKTGYKLTTTFKVLSTISASDISKVYTDSKRFTAKFLKSNGKVLANKYIKFKINGKTYTSKTNSNGVASLSLTSLGKGTYKIISYNRDGLTKTNTVKVVRSTSTTLTASDYTFLKSDSKTIKVKLLNKFGYAPGAGKEIKFTVNGKKYTAYTDSKGIAKLKLPNLANGVYTVKYNFAKTSFYTASSAKSTVTIIPTKTPTFTVKSTTSFGLGSGDSFKVALTSGDVPLAKKTVTLKLSGKTYTKTTDSKGVVSLPIDLAIGKYTVSYSTKAESKINSKSGSSDITVKQRTPTTVTWQSGTSSYQGLQTFKVLLKNSNGKALASKTVKLTVNSKTYTATTSSSGYATFSPSLNPGDYTVSFKYEASGDNDNAPSSGSAKVNVAKRDINGYGYWLFGADMKNVNLNTLASQGTSDIFLNYYAFTVHSQSTVESWIASANKVGIKVHIWMQTFYDGGWINPVKNGSPNTAYFKQVISDAQKYAKVKGVSGIHFDYLRYPGTAYKTSGGTAAISQFVKQAVEAVHGVNSNLIVSCALMPETTNNAYYYGQDYSVISKYMDVVVPMIYKGNYGKSTSWIKTTTDWFVDNSQGAKVWSGIQGYVSDSNTAKLSASALKTDAQNALSGNANGVIIFRWGQSNLLDFNSLNSGSSSGTISVSNIITGATNLKTYIEKNGALPNTVAAGGITFKLPDFLYLMGRAIYQIGNSNFNNIAYISGSSNPEGPFGDTISAQLTKENYLTVANNVANFIKNNKLAPNYASSNLGKIEYSMLVDSFSRVLAYYGSNSQLPNYVTISTVSSSASGNGLNQVNKETDISKYLKSSNNCQVGNANIKSLVNSLTKGLSSDLDKAKAIYNYVRDKISYSFYYNTNYGAVGTYNAKTGNCVDQSHLLVAMFRTAGLASRYVHGTCKFSSGSTYGHVWTQVLVNGNWYVCDATSTRNSFGTIVNWNTNSFTIHGTYASLSF